MITFKSKNPIFYGTKNNGTGINNIEGEVVSFDYLQITILDKLLGEVIIHRSDYICNGDIESLGPNKTPTYWSGEGKFQIDYDRLYSELVPMEGQSKTLNGELIRCISRLFYDYCNNGNCNARVVETESCENDDEDWYTDSEDEIISSEIDSYYLSMIELIEEVVGDYVKPKTKEVRSIIVEVDSPRSDYFNDKNMYSYNDMCDIVIDFILKNEDKELPLKYVEN